MTALAADAILKDKAASGLAVKVTNASQVYMGSFLALQGEDAAAGNGYVQSWAAAVGQIPLGLSLRKILGDTSASPVKETEFLLDDRVIPGTAVAGGAGTIVDVGKLVYLGDDNVASLTVTRPTRGLPLGIITRFHYGTTYDVMLFGFKTLLAISLAGNGQTVLHLGKYNCATIANGNIRTGFPMPFHGKFLSFYGFITDAQIGGASGAADLNLEIGGTNVTGGVLSMSTAAALAIGARIDATAITAANFFHEGDALDIEAANVSAMNAGSVDLYAEVARLPGV